MKTFEPFDGSVYAVMRGHNPHTLILNDRGMMSAGDGARYESTHVAEARTLQALVLNEVLQLEGVRTAVRGPGGNSVSLECDWLEMIPLEVVVRAINVPAGSYHARFPAVPFGPLEGGPQVEFFHKNTLDCRDHPPRMVSGNTLRAMDKVQFEAVKNVTMFPDPLLRPEGKSWGVYAPKAVFSADRKLHQIRPVVGQEAAKLCSQVALRVFAALQQFFRQRVNVRLLEIADATHLELADLKLEFGRNRKTQLIVGDTFTLDSMRLLVNGDVRRHVSKEPFRQGASVEAVNELYERVATMLAAARM